MNNMNNHDFHLISDDCIRTADHHNHQDFYRSYQGAIDDNLDQQQPVVEETNNNNNYQQTHRYSQRRQTYHPQNFFHHKNQPDHVRRYFEQRKTSLGIQIGSNPTNTNPINMLTLANVNNMDYR